MQIDPLPYELEVARVEAEVARLEAELEELDQREKNDRESLEIEEDSLALAQAELERLEGLLTSGTTSQSTVDATRRTMLTQRQSAQKLSAGLALLPSQKRAKEAALAAQRATLEQARLDLGYTAISLPFAATLGDVSLEVGQFVGRGELLFEAFGTDRVDIDAEFIFSDAKKLVGAQARAVLLQAAVAGELPEARLATLFQARVRMSSGELVSEWPARITGLRELVTESSRAVLLRVAVDDPKGQAVPGERPRLMQGAFCEVEMRGLPQPDRIAVPRSAIRNSTVLVLDADDRLRSREVRVDFEQGDAAVLSSGLQPGERVLVSDPGPALEGSLVAPREDDEAAAALDAWVGAAGE